jgi:hypothetical protein
MKEFKLIYFDNGEKKIDNIEELHKALIELRDSTDVPKSLNLISPNGDILTIAIGKEFGFVQFEHSSKDYPHYLIAVEKNKQIITKDYCEVDAGGTPTPIPGYACLHPEKVIEIVLFYFEHLKIPSFVEWDEI